LANAVSLDEKQYKLLQEYLSMVETIEEALVYVTSSFTDIEKTEGDRVLADVFEAFGQVSESNKLFKELFEDQPEILSALEDFEKVIDQAMKLNGHFQESNIKEEIVKGKLSPAFSAWKLEIDRVLKPLLNN
jgi:prephenate dehydrogenase